MVAKGCAYILKISKTTLKKAAMISLSLLIAIILFATLPGAAAALPASLAEMIESRGQLFELFYEPEESRASSECISDEIAKDENVSDDDCASGENSAILSGDDTNTVKAVNLCRYDTDDTPSLFLMNYSNYKIDLDKYSGKALPFEIKDLSSPTVLIIHSHGSEAYLPHGTTTYGDGETYRSTDPDRGVVSAGRELSRILRENGIGVIHDETMYDVEDFNTSYVRSKKAVAAYLAEYPTIKCVIDLHRDSIFTSSGENQKPICLINGSEASQIMLVVGTDQTGTAHPYWQSNLTFAVALQNEMNERYPTLARPVNIRTSSFNQQLCTGMLIVELGSCGNTVTEARAAAKLLGKCLASVLKEA